MSIVTLKNGEECAFYTFITYKAHKTALCPICGFVRDGLIPVHEMSELINLNTGESEIGRMTDAHTVHQACDLEVSEDDFRCFQCSEDE
jgi:hypothetical protein